MISVSRKQLRQITIETIRKLADKFENHRMLEGSESRIAATRDALLIEIANYLEELEAA